MGLLLLILSLLLGSGYPAHADGLLRVRCDESFPESMALLQSAITESGYAVSRVQHIDKGLAAFGYVSDKYRIVFFGKTEDIHWVRSNMPELMALLPLKFTIYQEGELTVIAALDPGMFANLYSDPAANTLFTRWSSDARDIIARLSMYCGDGDYGGGTKTVSARPER